VYVPEIGVAAWEVLIAEFTSLVVDLVGEDCPPFRKNPWVGSASSRTTPASRVSPKAVCAEEPAFARSTPSRSLIRLSDSKQSLSQSGVEMTANTVRRFRTAIMIMMVCIPISLSYEYIDTG
jgi:hypothetical protein